MYTGYEKNVEKQNFPVKKNLQIRYRSPNADRLL